MIRITSKRDGFRRAGRPHSGTVEYPDTAFTAEEVATLKAEPMLVVEVIPSTKGKTSPESSHDDK